MNLTLDDKIIPLKNLDKMYLSATDSKKADVIDYYIKISSLLLPHLHNRPFSMIFYPEGDNVDKSFYQKQAPENAPDWLKTFPVPSKKRGSIDFCLVNDLPSLVYLVNKSVMEMHVWFSRIQNLDCPDLAVLDLDPNGTSCFKEAVVLAQAYHQILNEYKLISFPKTSGSRGIHIYIPIKPVHSYAEVSHFLRFISGIVENAYPNIATQERLKAKRGNRVYLDAVQCAYGKTLAAPYSLRVKSGGLVSTPLHWKEVNSRLDPTKFDINTIFKRLDKEGDLLENLYSKPQLLPKFN